MNYKLIMKNITTNAHGFTLIELMVTLAVFAIISALAFPGFQLYQQNSSRVTNINDLISALNLARSEAVKRATDISVCASTNQTSCSAVNDWTTGWIVFSDDNSNGLLDSPAEDNNILLIHNRLSGANLVYTEVDDNDISVRFNSRGLSTTYDAGGANGSTSTFMRCDDRRNNDPVANQHARAVLVTATGRVRISRNDDGDINNIHEGTNGSLNCPP